MDSYVSSWSVSLMAGLESVVIGWMYGELNFKERLLNWKENDLLHDY